MVSMVSEPIYFDLSSSDDDEDHNLARKSTKLDAFLTVSKVFNIMDVDDDDIKIIERPTSTVLRKRDKARTIKSAIDDDECCILDTDPGAAAATTNVVAPLDSEELVMTGETGPVACRDFPHARYLCVHFPFKSSHHSKFCAQCHCYVCDALAPCPQWGTGNLSTDHCHASDKEPRWKTLRKITKCGSISPPVTTTAANLWTGDRIFRQTATAVTQVASTLSNKSGSVNQERVNSGAQSSLLHSLASATPPINQPSVGTPVGSGVLRNVQAAVTPAKKDPLIIKLKGKGRGKPSQPPHLGVRFSRPHQHRTLPQASFPIHRAPPALPRSTSTPSGRAGGGGAQQTLAHPSQAPLNPNAAPYIPAYVPPPPSAPPPPIPPPPPVEFDHWMQPPGADSTAADFSPVPHIPDSRYVSASAPSDHQACNMNTAPHHAHFCTPNPNITRVHEYVVQEYSNHIDRPHYASSSFVTSNGGAVDILAGPTEGWVVDAAVPFETFPTGISAVASPGDGQQASTTLNDVLEQMAGDDYLWALFSSQF